MIVLGKFDGILICTDLDGTLLNSNREISEENLSAIEYFKSEGGYFTFVTGRPSHTAGKIYKMVCPNAPYVCLNGGGIYDGKADKFISFETVPKDKLFVMLDFVAEFMPEMGIQANTEKAIYFCRESEAMNNFRKNTGYPLNSTDYRDIEEPIQKILFVHGDDAKIKALSEALLSHSLASEFDFIRSEETLYEILPKGVSKGRGMMKLADILGITKTVAVGDYNNDVSMIKAAKVGIAVANAVDEVKEVADMVTVDNDHSAIAKIIKDIESGTIRI